MFICRKTIKGFDLGKWRDTTGNHGLREAFEKYLRNLNEGEGFNGFFRKEFEGHEATYFRWKSVFDFLGLVEEEEGGDLEEQVGRIMEGDDIVKLRALATLCSNGYFDDKTFLVAVKKR